MHITAGGEALKENVTVECAKKKAQNTALLFIVCCICLSRILFQVQLKILIQLIKIDHWLCQGIITVGTLREKLL